MHRNSGGSEIKVPRIGDLGASEWVIFLPETALEEFVQQILNEHRGDRTPDTQDRNLVLYPLSYMP